ncbi:MAG: DUF507 family protein [Bdellovibrionales bacterium]
MKLTTSQLQIIATKVFELWKKNHVVVFKDDEKKVLNRMIEALKADYQKELDLEADVNKMLDQLERTNPGEFQRFKMYPLIKKQLAKEKKVIL